MIRISADRCRRNHRCDALDVCPTGALNQEGFDVPTIDPELCSECEKCTYLCAAFSGPSQDARAEAIVASQGADADKRGERFFGYRWKIRRHQHWYHKQ